MLLSTGYISDRSQRTYEQQSVDPVETPWYKGIASAIPQGIEHASDVAGASADSNFEERARKIKESRPDPVKMGTAAQILHGFSSIAAYGVIGAGGGAATGAIAGGAAGAVAGGVGALPGAAAGAVFGAKAGATASIGYLSGVDKYFEMIDQGVDHDTATKAAGITGTVMAIGAAAPAYIGKTLGRQVLSGVGINVGLGMAERGATGSLLEENYAKVAQHYKALDAQGMVLDAMLGAAFPLGGRFLGRMMKQEELDAAMTAQQDIAAQTRNPGLESSLENVETFKSNLAEADRQLLVEGRSVEDASLPRNTADIPNPEYGAMLGRMDEAFDDHLMRETGLTRDQLKADFERAVEIDRRVNETISNRIADSETARVDIAKTSEGEMVDVTPDMFALQEAHAYAKAMPDVHITDADGRLISASDVAKHIDEIIKDGKDRTLLNSVAISCYLTHGE